MSTETADIVIVGGGVMGASTAYHLARRGAAKVVLLERDEFFGTGATGKCAGGVRYQFSTEVNIRLSLASLPMLERFPEEMGQDVDYRQCGYLFVLTEEQVVDTFRRNFELQRSLGVEVEWLSGDEVRRRLPMMKLGDVVAGTFGPRDGLVDPNGVVQGYIARARELGVETRTQTNVTGVLTDERGVCGVETDHGNIASRCVVNAAGPWAQALARLADVELPIDPIRRQMVVTTPLPQIPSDFPFVIDFSQSLYWHREGDGLLTGMSNHAQGPGLDETVDADFELTALERSITRMPLLEDAGIAARWAGLYEVTPDAHPVFGRTPLDGFWIVGGFSGHGFMHGPIAGQVMSEYILDGTPSCVDVSMLDLARFVEQRPIVEYAVV